MSLMDPEDQEFGHKAAEDQEKVDELKREGQTEESFQTSRQGTNPGLAGKPMSLNQTNRAASSASERSSSAPPREAARRP